MVTMSMVVSRTIIGVEERVVQFDQFVFFVEDRDKD